MSSLKFKSLNYCYVIGSFLSKVVLFIAYLLLTTSARAAGRICLAVQPTQVTLTYLFNVLKKKDIHHREPSFHFLHENELDFVLFVLEHYSACSLAPSIDQSSLSIKIIKKLPQAKKHYITYVEHRPMMICMMQRDVAVAIL